MIHEPLIADDVPYPSRVQSHAALTAGMAVRSDAAAKLAGNGGYLTDRQTPGMLHAAVVRSPHPHARIVAVDVSAARGMPGVHAVVTADDVPGRNAFGLRVVDQPMLCSDKVRFVGDAVAAVAAESPALAAAAAASVVVKYELLPVIDDPDVALASNAVAIHAGGNLLHQIGYARGDIDQAWQACAHIADATYYSGRQMHGFMETEGGIVEPEIQADGRMGLVVYVGSQHPQRDRQALADILALPLTHIRVVASPLGGSFGGKDELTVQPIAALLALRSGRPVRLHLSRPESVLVGVKRHPFRIRMRTGCDAAGKLLAHDVELLADTGAYATHGPEVLDAAHEHAQGAYCFDAVRIDSRVAYTNNGVAGAFRGFGAVQVQFAIEQQIERLAQLAGIDVWQMRRRNVMQSRQPGPLGQNMAPSDAPAQVLEVLAQSPRMQAVRAATVQVDARYRRASGMAVVMRSDGFSHGGPNGGVLQLALAADGKIELRAGFTEMGQGVVAAMSALMCRHLHCSAEDTRPVIGRSDIADAGPTSASRATSFLHRGLQQAALDWRLCLQRLASIFLQCAPADLRAGAHGIRSARDDRLLLSYMTLAALVPADDLPLLTIDVQEDAKASRIEAAHYVFGSCAALAEVCLDTWTGRVRVEHLLIVAALGPVVAPQALLGQIEGGALMGLGMALLEELPAPQGRYSATNFDGYLMPSIIDAPVIEVIAVEDVPVDDQVGPRGAGEIGLNIAVPAIANAIARALGAPVLQVPVKPAQVMQMLATAASEVVNEMEHPA